jgi:flagellar biosynthesis GTPase FlhF
MGPNALILSTQNRRGKWLGQKKRIEVTAAFEPAKPAKSADAPASLESIFDEKALMDVFPHRRARKDDKTDRAVKPKAVPYVEISGGARAQSARPSPFETRLKQLGLSAQLSKDIAGQLLFEYPHKDLSSGPIFEKAAIRLLSDKVTVLALGTFFVPGEWIPIGLSGSGRTSVIVKLALAGRGRCDVKLSSVDRTKLFADEALRRYAKIIGVSFRGPQAAGSTTFVDASAMPIGASDEEWSDWERAFNGRKSFLVLESFMRLGEMERLYEQAQRFVPVGVVFTKVDQAVELGAIFEFLRNSKLPLLGLAVSRSFRVPFRSMDAKELSTLVVKGGLFHDEP